jgi:hypothetical protein
VPFNGDYKQGLPDCPALTLWLKHNHYDAALVATAGGDGDGTFATGIQEGSNVCRVRAFVVSGYGLSPLVCYAEHAVLNAFDML